MGLQLFNFVYNTLLGKANNNAPGNKLFLPRALAGMNGTDGQPYLPISASDWSLSNLSGATDISNNLATSWFNAYWPQLFARSSASPNPPALTQQMIDDAAAAVSAVNAQHLNVIPCPGCGPDLTIQSIRIDGLSNVKVSGAAPQVTASASGYTAQITLDFNAYPADGQNWNRALSLGGVQAGIDSSNQQPFVGLDFSLSQCLGFIPRRGTGIVAPPPTLHLAPSSCNAQGFDCAAAGLALLTVGNAELIANTTVGVSADGKQLSLSLQSLTLQGTGGATPAFTLQNLQWQTMAPVLSTDFSLYYSIWTTFYKNLLTTQEAATLLSGKINEALNSPDNLAQVESLLNTQLASAFDSIFGSSAVASSTVDTDANAVDKYLFNRARAALNDQASYVYVPTVVLGNSSPLLEPFTATNLSLAGPYVQSAMGQQISVSQIVLSNLVINGLSNLLAPANNVVFGSNQQATLDLLLGTLNPGPALQVNGQSRTVPSPPVTASTPFTLNVQVGANTPVPLSGTMTLSLNNRSGTLGVSATLDSTGDTPDQLALNFSRIVLNAAAGDVTVAMQFDGGGELYNQLVDSIVNQPTVIDAIVSALNDYVSQNLADISRSATEFAQQALNNLGS